MSLLVAPGMRLRWVGATAAKPKRRLATALTRATGEHWSRVMVGKLETGGKELTVEVLLTIAGIQNLPYSFYLEGPELRQAKGVQRGWPVPAMPRPVELIAS